MAFKRLNDFLLRRGSAHAGDNTKQRDWLDTTGATGGTDDLKEIDFFENQGGFRVSTNTLSWNLEFTDAPITINTTTPTLSIGVLAASISTGGDGISSVSGTISDGQSITISGNTFGSGCANIFFEDFSAGGITAGGQDLTTSNTSFDAVGQDWIPTSDTDSRSGSYSMHPWNSKTTDSTDFAAGICEWNAFGAGVTEVFSCFATKNPIGKRMPGNTTTGNNLYGTGSQWKVNWFLGDDLAGGYSVQRNAQCCPQLTHKSWRLYSSGGAIIDPIDQSDPTFWEFGEWVRMTTWLKAGAEPAIDNGDVYFEALCPTGVRYAETLSVPVFEDASNDVKFTGLSGTFVAGETITGSTSGATGVIKEVFSRIILEHNQGSQDCDGVGAVFVDSETITGGTSGATATTDMDGNSEHATPHEWRSHNIPGYLKPLDSDTYSYAPDVKVLYDDIYVAYGDNAAARVELGNNAVYESCTSRAICDYASWASGSISATVREGDLNLASDTWLFLTLSDNSTRYSYKVV